MIRIFLKNLPYTLTQPMFREFEAKKRELKKWSEKSKHEKIIGYLNQREIIEYIFALGIYYRYVIAPLTKTGEFFERIETYDMNLKVGGREIDYQYRKSIMDAQSHFNAIIKNYGINEAFFFNRCQENSD